MLRLTQALIVFVTAWSSGDPELKEGIKTTSVVSEVARMTRQKVELPLEWVWRAEAHDFDGMFRSTECTLGAAAVVEDRTLTPYMSRDAPAVAVRRRRFPRRL